MAPLDQHPVAERAFDHDREFVRSQTRDEIGLAQLRFQPPSHLAQDRIGSAMAERVVDRLEVVEIEIEQRDPADMVSGQPHSLAQVLGEGMAIGKTGQIVVQGEIPHALLVTRSLGHVTQDASDKAIRFRTATDPPDPRLTADVELYDLVAERNPVCEQIEEARALPAFYEQIAKGRSLHRFDILSEEIGEPLRHIAQAAARPHRPQAVLRLGFVFIEQQADGLFVFQPHILADRRLDKGAILRNRKAGQDHRIRHEQKNDPHRPRSGDCQRAQRDTDKDCGQVHEACARHAPVQQHRADEGQGSDEDQESEPFPYGISREKHEAPRPENGGRCLCRHHAVEMRAHLPIVEHLPVAATDDRVADRDDGEGSQQPWHQYRSGQGAKKRTGKYDRSEGGRDLGNRSSGDSRFQAPLPNERCAIASLRHPASHTTPP